MSAVMAGISLPAMADSYKLDVSRGSFPKNVSTENLNGTAPKKDAYKRGWSDNGWVVDRIGTIGYVALCPTYHPGEATESALTLPPITVEPGQLLQWSAESLYKHFPESYRVEVLTAGGTEPTVLMEIEEEEFNWTWREVDLMEYAGQEITLRFVCTSENGYMLGLDQVTVDGPLDSDPSGMAPAESEGEFTRNLLVDHGTGMWCNNCPQAEVYVNQLEHQYGDRVIMLNTHVNDALDNLDYWQELKWYDVPRMMLNRIKATEGTNISKFHDYTEAPATFAVAAEANAEETAGPIGIKATVKVSENTDNASDRYRIGYVITGNFHEPDNMEFLQKNSCILPTGEVYYFLPERIMPALMYYDDVTLTSESAFTGIGNSLPESLATGEEYEFTMSVALPELLADAKKARAVVFVIDTESGEIMNCAQTQVGSGTNRVAAVAEESACIRYINGSVILNLREGIPYILDVFTAEGAKVYSSAAKSEGVNQMAIDLPSGYYLMRAAWNGGSAVCKAIVNK